MASIVTLVRSRAVMTVWGVGALCLAIRLDAQQRRAEPVTPTAFHVTIPFLVNATKPSDLDFEGGECDIDQTGSTMVCQFQQVFLTVSPFDRETCLVTTNRYERTFQKQSDARWISIEGPEGECGVLDETTLDNEGGVRWTLRTRKVVTKKDGSPLCRDIDEAPEILSWQNLRRPLPCTFLQPGAISH